MGDIVEKLKGEVDAYIDDIGIALDRAELRALLDEIVRLRADKTLLIDALATAVEDAQEAEAERDRLRAALTQIADGLSSEPPKLSRAMAADIARAAVK